MRRQWHPLLAQFLREDYNDRLSIKDSLKLGRMPLEMDLLITPSVPTTQLPYPFMYLGETTTLAELKGPGDTAIWEDLAQIESYACLYQKRDESKIEDRSQITLWLISSKFSENFNQPPGDYIENLTSVGEGVSGGSLAKFPIYLIDLGELPITLDTIPLLMVYEDRKEREKEIIRFVIEHYDELRKYGSFLFTLHIRALKEVLEEMDLRNLRGLELDVPGIIDLLGLDRIVETAGKNKLIQKIGPEEAIEIASLYLTRERIEELLDKKKKVD
ncbi:hypothetical protein H8E77_43585 [bacterium]|nr:hypothetical protein [bacterium]